MPKHKHKKDDELKDYRPGVGIALFNAEGKVLVAERLDNPGAWQMPQGGIDKGEDPEVAVFREMKEEIGTKNARIMGKMKDWITYDIPERTAKRLWGGKYKGQKQQWIALEYQGLDSDIDLHADKHPEFSKWKWVPIEDLLSYVVPFKRDVYKKVIEEFSQYSDELKSRNQKKTGHAPRPHR